MKLKGPGWPTLRVGFWFDAGPNTLCHVASLKDVTGRLLRFMATYDDGFYCPEKCDVYEPIREPFDPDDLSVPIRWLSQTSGRVMMKRTKPFRYEGFVENMRFSNYWIDGNPVLLS